MILVTGGSGFVGSAVCAKLSGLTSVRATGRGQPKDGALPDVDYLIASLSSDLDWSAALRDVRAVVHCAARVHVMRDAAADPLLEFRGVNVDATLHLAAQAADAGVKRFVFISSIKVNGENTMPGLPFCAQQVCAPIDPYGISKREAEDGLRALAKETGMEVVIIRPPLVYGPGVKANFRSLMKWIWRGVPLPVGGVTENRRSLVALDNLVDLIVTCVDHPAAANQTFLVSDGEDLSTAGLVLRIGNALGRSAKLIPVPTRLLTLGARMIGRPGIAQRLCGSLQVDIGKTQALLGWVPPVSVDCALKRTAEHWLATETAMRG